MSKLEKLLPEMYREMHAASSFKGDSWRVHLEALAEFIGEGHYSDSPADKLSQSPHVPVLDYGCGPTGGMSNRGQVDKWFAGKVVPYDPYVEAFSADPWKSGFRTFFTCDVFEHMTLVELSALMLRLRKHASCDKIFVALSTRPANKFLPNGLNAHLTIRPAGWWYGLLCGLLAGVYECETADADLVRDEAVFAFSRIPPPPIATVDSFLAEAAVPAEEVTQTEE